MSDDDLIPWRVLSEHRWSYSAQMLRAEARRRAGQTLREGEAERLEKFLKFLRKSGRVVHYAPETDSGFVYVPRRPTDTDIIRRPERVN